MSPTCFPVGHTGPRVQTPCSSTRTRESSTDDILSCSNDCNKPYWNIRWHWCTSPLTQAVSGMRARVCQGSIGYKRSSWPSRRTTIPPSNPTATSFDAPGAAQRVASIHMPDRSFRPRNRRLSSTALSFMLNLTAANPGWPRPHVASSSEHGHSRSSRSAERESVSTLDGYTAPRAFSLTMNPSLYLERAALHFNLRPYHSFWPPYRDHASRHSKSGVYAEVVCRECGERIAEERQPHLDTSTTPVCP